MKRAKYADKITDLVEDTLVHLECSDDFTVWDNLDEDRFSFTLEYDRTGERYEKDLDELYTEKQEEDIKVKDQYRNHLKSGIENFVNNILNREANRISEANERIASGGTYTDYDVYDDEYDEDEEEEEDDEYDEEDEEYDEDEDEDEEEDYDEETERNLDIPVYRSLHLPDPDITDHDMPFEEYDTRDDNIEATTIATTENPIKIYPAKEILPVFLKEEFNNIVFIQRDDLGILSINSDDYKNACKEVSDFVGKDNFYIVPMDNQTDICISDRDIDYVEQFIEDLTGIDDADILEYKNGEILNVFDRNKTDKPENRDEVSPWASYIEDMDN